METAKTVKTVKAANKKETFLWAKAAAEAALDKKATDVLLIKVGPTLVIVDYFVLATAGSTLQLRAVINAVEDQLQQKFGIKPIGREGMEKLDWVLLDYGDFVVHAFLPNVRDFYRLETLYNDAEITTLDAEA